MKKPLYQVRAEGQFVRKGFGLRGVEPTRRLDKIAQFGERLIVAIQRRLGVGEAARFQAFDLRLGGGIYFSKLVFVNRPQLIITDRCIVIIT